MNQIVIVDDKKQALDVGKLHIDWESCGFTLSGVCPDPVNAYSLCMALKPELLLISLQETPDEGIQLMQSLREAGLTTEFIILTDLEHFQVVQDALDMGIHSVLLTPLDLQKLENAVISANQKVERQKASAHFIQAYTNYNGAIFLHKLLSNPEITEKGFAALCSDYNISLPDGNFLIALFHLDAPKQANYEDLHMALIETINEAIMSDSCYVLTNMLSTKNIPMLVYEKESHGLDGILAFLNTIRENFKHATGTTITIGISLFFRQITAASRALEQAKSALESAPNFGKDCIIDYSNSKNEVIEILHPFTQREIYALCNMIRKFDLNGSTAFINEYFNKASSIKNLNIEELRANILELSIYILKENVQNTAALSDILGRTFIPANELQHLELISELREWIINLISVLISHPEIVLSSSYSALVKNAIIYTMSHYGEQLTAASIAQQLYVSSNHFMRVFKKEVGKTYGHYLAEYRVKMAKILLKTNEYKIYEIGQMVGYPNVKYFNKIFKTYTGHVPTYFCTEVEE